MHNQRDDLITIVLVVGIYPHIHVQSNTVYQNSAQMFFYKAELNVLYSLPHLRDHGRVLVHTIHNQRHEEVGGYHG
jgi:hypothetical protein